MSSLRRLFAMLIAVSLFTAAEAAPILPDKPLIRITAENASRVCKVGELARDVFRIVRGPGPGRIAVLGWETPVEVLDARSLARMRHLAPGRRVVGFASASDGRTVAWCENGTRVELVDLRTEKSEILEASNAQPAMAFSPDDKLLATGGYGTHVKLWDVSSGGLVRSLDAGPSEGALTPVFSPDGKQIAVGHRNAQTRVFDAATGQVQFTLPWVMSHELRFHPKGKVLAVSYVDGKVGLWDTTTGNLLRNRASGAQEVFALDWTPAGDLLVTAGLRGKLVLWDPRDLTILKELDAPEAVFGVRFSPDGSRFYSTGGSQALGGHRKLTMWAVDDSK